MPHRSMVVFTGAGISVASGLPTFDGDYRGIPVREILERDFFFQHTKLFYEFYREELLGWREAPPNPAHIAVAKAGIPVVTQNIDGLHQKAGSHRVIELHGNLRELRCEGCGRIAPSDDALSSDTRDGIPHCKACSGLLKPVIVLFGEALPYFEEAYSLMAGAEHVLVVGTSLAVMPAAGLVSLARSRGASVDIINAEAHIGVPKAIEEFMRQGEE